MIRWNCPYCGASNKTRATVEEAEGCLAKCPACDGAVRFMGGLPVNDGPPPVEAESFFLVTFRGKIVEMEMRFIKSADMPITSAVFAGTKEQANRDAKRDGIIAVLRILGPEYVS